MGTFKRLWYLAPHTSQMYQVGGYYNYNFQWHVKFVNELSDHWKSWDRFPHILDLLLVSFCEIPYYT